MVLWQHDVWNICNAFTILAMSGKEEMFQKLFTLQTIKIMGGEQTHNAENDYNMAASVQPERLSTELEVSVFCIS